MLPQAPLLVMLVKLVDRLPGPEPPPKRERGRQKVYADRLIVKALVIMIIRRLYSAYSLLAFLDQDTDLTRALRAELTDAQGRFPRAAPGNVGCRRCPTACPVGWAAWDAIW